MRISDVFPDPDRTDVGLVLSSEWAVGSPDRLVTTADAVIAAWQSVPWPGGLLTYALYLDADGDLIRHYSQWTSKAAFDDFNRTGRQPRIDLIDAAVPGIVRRDHTEYHLYRGSRTPGDKPGAMVAVRVDTDDGVLARTWVDAVFEALAGGSDLPAGGLGAFFHISTDGRHVLNYAEWADADAHRKALAATGRGIAQGPLWDKVQTMPGVRPRSVTRYRLYRTLTA
jgi:quinol monooxygenase YgiN